MEKQHYHPCLLVDLVSGPSQQISSLLSLKCRLSYFMPMVKYYSRSAFVCAVFGIFKEQWFKYKREVSPAILCPSGNTRALASSVYDFW